MKNFYRLRSLTGKVLFLFWIFFIWFIHKSAAQKVNYELQVQDLYGRYSKDDCCTNHPDPSWKFCFKDNTRGWSGWDKCYHRGGVSTSYTWWNVNGHLLSGKNTWATNVSVGLDSWEDDTGSSCTFNSSWFNNDDDRNSGWFHNIPIRQGNPRQWQTHGWFATTNDAAGRAKVRLRIKWEWAELWVTQQPDRNNRDYYLQSNQTINLNTQINYGKHQGITFQWQVCNSKALNPSGGWKNISGATSASYTPPKKLGRTCSYRLKAKTIQQLNGNATAEVYSRPVRVNYLPSISTTTNNVCAGSPIKLSVTNGITGTQYIWKVYKTSNLNVPVKEIYEAAPSFVLEEAGSYKAELIINLGGDLGWTLPVRTSEFYVRSSPVLSVISNDVVCNGASNGSLTISTTGGITPYQYSIDNGASWTNKISFNNLPPNNYTVKVKDNYSCSDEEQITISQPNMLFADVDKTDISCFGLTNGKIIFKNITGGSGDNQYSGGHEFSVDGENWKTDSIFKNLRQGVYTAYMRDANSPDCSILLQENIMINSPQQLSADVNHQNIKGCFGTTNGRIEISNIKGGTGEYEFSIDFGNTWLTNSTFENLTAGEYQVWIRDKNFSTCEQKISNNIEITQPEKLSASVKGMNVRECYGRRNGSIEVYNIKGGSGTYEYTIDGGINWTTTSKFENLDAGNYNVQIRDAVYTDCPLVLDNDLEIRQPKEIIANLSKENVTGCNGNNNGSITIKDAIGGSYVYQYSIDAGTTWQDENVFQNLNAENYSVQIRNLDYPTCVVALSENYVIEQPELLKADISKTDVNGCFGNMNGKIEIKNAQGGSGDYEYSINAGAGWKTNNVFNNLKSGKYTVLIRDINSLTCVITLGTININQPATLSASIEKKDVIGCYDNSNAEILFRNSAGGSGNYEYSIDAGANWQNSNLFGKLPAGSYYLMMRDAMVKTCIMPINPSLVISQPEILSATVNKTDVTKCYGSSNASIEVTNPKGGSGNYEYSINDGIIWQTSTIFKNLTADFYNVQIRDANNPDCIIILNENLEISQPEILSANITKTDVSACFGNTNAEIQIVDVQGGSSSYEYTINGGTTWQTEAVFSNLTSGFYNIQIRDVNNSNCIISLNENFEISQPQILSAEIIKTNVSICNGNNNASIELVNAQGGSGNYEFSVDGGNTWKAENKFENLGASTYNVQIRDANSTDCIIILNNNLEISQPEELFATAQKTDVSACFGNDNASIQIKNMIGGSGNYQYTIDGGNTWKNEAVFSNLIIGNYNVQMRDTENPTCIFVVNENIEISQPIIISAEINKKDVTSCFNSADGNIEIVNANGGSGSYQYSIDGGLNWKSKTVFTKLSAGFYNVQIRDAVYNSCVIVLNEKLELSQPELITAEIIKKDVTACFGNANAEIHIENAQGGNGTYEYSIDGGNTWQNVNIFTNLTSGIYNVQIRDANYSTCSFILNENLEISQPEILSAEVTKKDVTGCFGNANAEIHISNTNGGSGNYQYTIDGGINWLSSPDFTELTASAYNIYMRDANHTECSILLEENLVINQPEKLSATIRTVNVTGNPENNNGEIHIENPTGGSSNYEYSIDNGTTWQSSSDFIELYSGTYQVLIRDAVHNSCEIVLNNSLYISKPGELNALLEVKNVSECYENTNASIHFTNQDGGTGTYEYTINGGANWVSNYEFTNLSAGVYNVQIRDKNHINYVAVLNENLEISQPEKLVADVNYQNVTNCYANINATIEISNQQGGSGTYEYTINDGTKWEKNPNFEKLSAGLYNVKMRDAKYKSCAISLNENLEISQPQELTSEVEIQNVTECYGNENAKISFLNSNGGSQQFEYNINGTDWSTDTEFTSLVANQYSALIRDKQHPECKKTIQEVINISQPQKLTANFETTDIISCYGNNEGAIFISEANGGSENFEFSIDGENWKSETFFNQLVAGVYSLKIRDANFTNCVLSVNDNIEISQPEKLSASSSSQDVTGCNGSENASIKVENSNGGNGTYEYSIDNGTDWSNQNVFENLDAGVYTVIIRDAQYKTCQKVINEELTISQPEVLTAEKEIVNPNCFNASNGEIKVNLQGGEAPYNYNWNNDNINNSNLASNLKAGVYTLIITDNQNCEIENNFELVQPDEIKINLPKETTLCIDDNVSLNAKNKDANYQWTKDGETFSSKASFTTDQAGTYIVKVSLNDQCFAYDTAKVIVLNDAVHANFLIPSEAHVGDTIAAVEISTPMPDQVTWFIPATFNEENSDRENPKLILANQEGTYTLALRAFAGGCQDYLEKEITILPYVLKKLTEGNRNIVLVKTNLYPNPTQGKFDVDVELSKEMPVEISIYNLQNSIKYKQQTGSGQSNYKFNFDVSSFAHGSYVVKIKAGGEEKTIKFVKN